MQPSFQLFAASHHIFTSFSLSSIIMCIHDCLHDPGSGLSQDQSFNLTWAPRSTSKCRVTKFWKHCVCVCVLFGILYVVQPVFSFTATVLEACTVSSLDVKAESKERPLGLLTMFPIKTVSQRWMSLVSFLITKPS